MGYAFHLSWICLLFYRVVPSVLTDAGAGSFLDDHMYLASMAALVAALLAGIAATKPFMRLAESRGGAVVAPVLTALGSVLSCLYVTSQAMPIVMAGGILTGVGSAVLGARWASVFGRAKSRAIIQNFTLLLASVASLCMTASYLPTPALFALVCILPLASGACLAYARSYQAGLPRVERFPHDGADAQPETGTRPDGAAKGGTTTLTVLAVGAVVLVGFVSGGLVPFASSPLAGFRYDIVFCALAAILALVFVFVLGWADQGPSFITPFAVPLVVLGAIALPFVQYVATNPEDMLYAVGNAAFELVILLGAVLFALLLDHSPARSFMVTRATLALADLAGAIAAELVIERLDQTIGIQLASMFMLVSAELLVAMLVVAYLIERRRQLPRESAEMASEPRVSGCLEPEVGAQAPHGGARAGDGPRVDGDAQVAGGTQAGASAQAGAQAAGPDDVRFGCETRKGDLDSLDGRTERAASHVEALALQHRLSPREAEVLALLAKGLSPAQIQERLYISQGTINYHMRNIYAKLGVHSRQELMLLVLEGR